MNKSVICKNLFIFLSFIMLSGVVSAQIKSPSGSQKILYGKVTDEKGDALIGVNIVVKGTNIGTVTDNEGKFSLSKMPKDPTLLFSYVGYESISKPITSFSQIVLVMKETHRNLDDVVVVGYGTQKKVTVTGALSSVSGNQLLKAPVSAINNALVGRTPGLVAVQRGGEPGKDVAQIYIRGISTFGGGTSPLIIVDGVERQSFNEIDPNEVESVNILKDASTTAVFGIRGANGVIIITTKTGHEGHPQISYTMDYGIQNPIGLPKLLGSYQYALLNNEAAVNSGMTPTFTDFDLERFKKRDDPYFHPDVDWIKYMIRDESPQSQQNINISGGTKDARYFVSLGAFNQQGAFKMGDIFKQFSANPEYKRYNIRTNIDVDWTKEFQTSIKVGASIVNSNYSGGNSNSFLGTILSANPMMSPVIVDGKIIRNVQGSPSSQVSNTPLYQLLSYGYNKNFSSNLNIDISFKYKLDKVLSGLSARAKVAYDSYYNQSVIRNKSIPMYDLYRAKPDTSGYYQDPVGVWSRYTQPVLVHNTFEGPVVFSSESFSKNRAYYGEGALEYSRTIDGNTIGCLLLANFRRYYDGSSGLIAGLPYNIEGFVGRFTYNYKDKYFAELNYGYNGSENFARNKMFGSFPAGSVGYIISEEPFFPKNNFFTFLKVRGSLGLVGNDKNGGYRFIFLPSSYKTVANSYNDNRYYFGQSGILAQGYEEASLGNPDVTWEKARKINIGIDSKFYGDKLTFSTDYFFEKRYDILWSPTIPVSFGNSSLVAPMNIGMAKNRGCEFELGYKDKAGEFNYFINANYSFARNKIIYMDEPPAPYPGLSITGNRIGQPKGLIADGLYNTWDEINDPQRPKSIWEGAGLQPGDIKYVDINDDGKIDENDRTNIGYPNIPEIVYGLSYGIEWKGFEISALFQGVGNVSTYINGDGVIAFQGSQKAAFDFNLERWTPERYAKSEKITYPRVTLGNYPHNYQYSSYWLKDASYLRLKNLEFAYNLRIKYLKEIGLNAIRIFVNGQNMFTITKMPYYDPEIAANTSGAMYPIMRVFNFGLNIQF